MPQQMLMYRAASWFIRTYAPEISNGMHTAEEIEDVGRDFRDVETEIADNANSERFDAPPPALPAQVKPENKPEPARNMAATPVTAAAPTAQAADGGNLFTGDGEGQVDF
jgi:hypothetical protein